MPGGFFAAPAGAAVNPDLSYEPQGFGTDGQGTLFTSGGTSNTKGASWVAIGSASSSAWYEFFLFAGVAASASSKFLVDISFDGSTVAIPNISMYPGTTGGWIPPVRIPMAVAAGTTIYAKVQAASANATIHLAIEGMVANANSPPGFTHCEAIIAADTTNTRPSTIDVPDSNTWTQLIASTARAYGAILAIMSENSVTPAAAQSVSAILGIGASSSEVEIARGAIQINTSAPTVARGVIPLIQKTIPISTRISAKILAPTSNSDNFRIGLLGFY